MWSRWMPKEELLIAEREGGREGSRRAEDEDEDEEDGGRAGDRKMDGARAVGWVGLKAPWEK